MRTRLPVLAVIVLLLAGCASNGDNASVTSGDGGSQCLESSFVVTAPAILDHSSAGDLRCRLALATASPSPLVVVDMTDVLFLDSTCLGVLAGAARCLRPGRRLVLANVGDRMRRTLKHSAFDALGLVHAQDETWPFARVPLPRSHH